MTESRPRPSVPHSARLEPPGGNERRAPAAAGAEPFLSGDEIAALTGGRLLRSSARRIRGAAVDSRQLRPGMLFAALPGERVDGHDFLTEAVAAGAAGLLVTREPTPRALGDLGDVSVVEVSDGLAALHALAASWRLRFEPLVVGVTGSYAKTSTKEAIAAVLARRFRTLRSPGNQNNEIGLPLTLLELGPEHEAAVLEMGMYVGGEIATLARMARPRIGVVTAVYGVHLSRAGSLQAIEDAKAELVEALPIDGVAVLNADDERVRAMTGRTRARAVLYGFSPDADVRGEAIESAGTAGMRFTLVSQVGRRAIATPALGRHAVHNAIAAAAVGLAVGLDLAEIAEGLAAGWSADHRSQLIRGPGVLVLDDSYNASPPSVLAALEVLAGLPGRKVAVLGEMLELGEGTAEAHRVVGRATAGTVDLLLVVGDGARLIAESASEAGLPAGRLSIVPDRGAALALLRRLLRPGDSVLVKASRGAGLELIVEGLLDDAGMGSSRSGTAARFQIGGDRGGR